MCNVKCMCECARVCLSDCSCVYLFVWLWLYACMGAAKEVLLAFGTGLDCRGAGYRVEKGNWKRALRNTKSGTYYYTVMTSGILIARAWHMII